MFLDSSKQWREDPATKIYLLDFEQCHSSTWQSDFGFSICSTKEYVEIECEKKLFWDSHWIFWHGMGSIQKSEVVSKKKFALFPKIRLTRSYRLKACPLLHSFFIDSVFFHLFISDRITMKSYSIKLCIINYINYCKIYLNCIVTYLL